MDSYVYFVQQHTVSHTSSTPISALTKPLFLSESQKTTVRRATSPRQFPILARALHYRYRTVRAAAFRALVFRTLETHRESERSPTT
jgi:hypothetical protein